MSPAAPPSPGCAAGSANDVGAAREVPEMAERIVRVMVEVFMITCELGDEAGGED